VADPDRSRLRVAPALEPAPGTRFQFAGLVGERIEANQEQWLLVAPKANPAMLQMFRDRDRRPARDLVPWAGEFAGKYLTSAVEGYRLTQAPRLRAYLEEFVADLIATQDKSGYVGPFPQSDWLTGRTIRPDGRAMATWDAWGHYHIMLGLLCWYQELGDPAALRACRAAADFLCRTFLDTDQRLVDTGSEEMNLAPIHVFCLLYAETGDARYLRMAREIERDFETPPAGDYVRTALAGQPFFQTPKPRWESLHPIQGVAELYFLTGEDRYRQAFHQIWQSIRQGDRHNTGGFSSGEKATGNPYDPGAIETCCTIAWLALSVDELRISGDSTVADELELATFNAVLGAQSPSGRWWTYNTPMDGERKASAHDIVFQARAGSPELNCCSVNGPRGLGLLASWAVLRAADGVALNYYGPSTIELALPSGKSLRLVQETSYPLDGDVRLRVVADRAERFVLRLRIPAWSRRTRVLVDGEEVRNVAAGTYLTLDRTWSDNVVELRFDFSLQVWPGQHEAQRKISIYRGPLLLAGDPRFNQLAPDELPILSPDLLAGEPVAWAGPLPPWLLLRFPTDHGELFLCDFASAGQAGNLYRTWLPAVDNPRWQTHHSVFAPTPLGGEG
jgi:uncharacterized protein